MLDMCELKITGTIIIMQNVHTNFTPCRVVFLFQIILLENFMCRWPNRRNLKIKPVSITYMGWKSMMKCNEIITGWELEGFVIRCSWSHRLLNEMIDTVKLKREKTKRTVLWSTPIP